MFCSRCALVFVMLLLTSSVIMAQDSLNISQVVRLYDFWDWPTDVQMHGNYAYVAMGSAGLRVINIEDLENPVEVAQFLPSNGVANFTLRDSLIYAVFGTGNPAIVNIVDPHHPEIVSIMNDQYISGPITLMDNYAYVVSDVGFIVLDIGDPAFPAVTGEYYTPLGVNEHSIDRLNHYVFLAAGPIDYLQPEGIWVVDVTDPTNPVDVAHYPFPCAHLTISDTLLISQYANDIIDISAPESPEWIGVFDLPYETSRLVVQDTLFYAASEDSLFAFSIADPFGPVRVSSLGIPGGTELPLMLDVAENVACMLGRSGMHLADVSTPTVPILRGFLTNSNEVRDVAVYESYAYVVLADSSLRVLDVSSPAQPLEVSEWHAPGSLQGCMVQGHYVYAWDSNCYLHTLDISIPSSPAYSGSFYSGASIHNAVGYDDVLFVVTFVLGVQILDLSDPSDPNLISSYNVPGFEEYIWVADDILYVSNHDGLYIVDVTDPAAPDLLSFYDDELYTGSVAVDSEYAYLSTIWGWGHPGSITFTHVIDVSDPSAPFFVRELGSSSTVGEARVFQNHLIRIEGHQGLSVNNLSNDGFVSLSGYYRTPGYPLGLDVSAGYAYVADKHFFGIYDISAATASGDSFIPHPSSFSLSNFPNPFNSSTDIRFDLPQTERVQVDVFDITGRRVASLADDVFAAGSHHVTFDAAGLPSGVYVYRLTSGDYNRARKMVLLR